MLLREHNPIYSLRNNVGNSMASYLQIGDQYFATPDGRMIDTLGA
jgi:hypothetical protein